MTFEQEFQKQWTSLCNFLNSEIIKSSNGNVDWKRIQSLFENEKKKWLLPGQYNNAWFEKLKRTHPDTAHEFEVALKAAKVEADIPNVNNSPMIAIITTAIGIVLGFGISKVFTLSTILMLFLTIGGAAIGGSVGAALYSKKKNSAFEELCSAYMEQLRDEGKVLAHIVSGLN